MALLLFLMEAHELVHTGVGRLLCGDWGTRDFNVWTLCTTCAVGHPWNLAATFAAPLFTFGVGWWGYALLHPRNPMPRRSLGFALVFATLPFARIVGALMGGNDEVYALSKLLPYQLAWGIGASLVLLATLPPLARTYSALQGKARRWLFMGFFLLPTVLAFFLVLGALNSLLARGFLAFYGILGSPVLVTCWTVLVCASLGLSYHSLFTLAQCKTENTTPLVFAASETSS